MKKHHITLTALALTTFIVGFLLREVTTGSPTGTEQQSPGAGTAESHHLSALNPPSDDSDPTQPERDLARFENSEGTHRWLRLVELLEGATLDEMPGIAASVAGYKEVQLVGQRWLELDANDLYQSSLAELERTQAGEKARFDYSYLMQFLGEEVAGT